MGLSRRFLMSGFGAALAGRPRGFPSRGILSRMPAGQGQAGLGLRAPRPLFSGESIQLTARKAYENQRRSRFTQTNGPCGRSRRTPRAEAKGEEIPLSLLLLFLLPSSLCVLCGLPQGPLVCVNLPLFLFLLLCQRKKKASTLCRSRPWKKNPLFQVGGRRQPKLPWTSPPNNRISVLLNEGPVSSTAEASSILVVQHYTTHAIVCEVGILEQFVDGRVKARR